MKKSIIIFVIIISIFTLTACNNKTKKDNKESNSNVNPTDALKFKEEYEGLNGTESKSGKKIRTLEIPEDNPFIYKNENDIVELMDKKESFIVYFGFPSCPWCRSIVPTLINVANDLDIKEIYYVNVYDIRNVLEVKDGKVEETKKGSDGYYKLLDKLDNVLSDYSLTDDEGKEVDTKQKRIYAPNVVVIIDGKAKKLETGISKKQDDAYMELSDEIKEDLNKILEKLLKVYKDDSSSCSLDSKC